MIRHLKDLTPEPLKEMERMNLHRMNEAAVGADEPNCERFTHLHLDHVG